MNLRQINEFRVSQGLKPLQADPNKQAKGVALERNRRARAQANRDLKARRHSR